MNSKHAKHAKHVIIGAGIAGLYIALQLKKRREPFIVLEASKKPRSKIVSIREENAVLELGASVFHLNQPKLLSMIEHLGLSQKVKKLSNARRRYIFENLSSEQAEENFKLIYKKAKQYCLTAGMSFLTVEQNAQECLTKDEFKLLKTCWDCWFENANMNAYTFYQADSEKVFYHMEGGLQQILKAAIAELKEYVLFDNRVSKVQYNRGTFLVKTKEEDYLTEYLYVCTGLDELEEINFNVDISRYVSLAHCESSMRMFFVLHKGIRIDPQVVGQVWFKWMIRITPSIYMIYMDSDLANSLNKLSDAELTQRWLFFINLVYDYALTEKHVKKVIRAYWPAAYEVLDPIYWTRDGQEAYHSIPFICTSLPTVYDQAYIEGHLLDI